MSHDNNAITYHQIDDYVQSANTLFHFMKKPEYLKAILLHSALIPRYCIENIDYLGVSIKTHTFNEIAVLQKCFCDIPFHKLADTFPIQGTGLVYDSLNADERADLEKTNTHFAYYGEYAIAFSKHWGEQKKLQPIHYLNKGSDYTYGFSSLLKSTIEETDISDSYAQDVINRLAFIKPLRGIMKREYIRSDSTVTIVEVIKNFHDECEWRFVPCDEAISSLSTTSVIANPSIIALCDEINKGIENDQNKGLWLQFSYDEIRYIIVPDNNARIEITNAINDLPDSCFSVIDNIPIQKLIMISKILVLSEIRKDW